MTQNAATQAVAGWYPRPDLPGQLCFWDGTAWTNNIHTDFAGVNVDALRRGPAQNLIREMQATIRSLEELVNRHGLRDYQAIADWRKEQERALVSSLAELEAARQKALFELAELDRGRHEKLAMIEREVAALREARGRSLDQELAALTAEVAMLRATVVPLRDSAPLQEVGFFDYEHPAEASTELATELESVRSQIKNKIRDKTAATATTTLTFEGSAAKGKRLVNNLTRILLRAYNAEAENAVKATKAGNLDTAQTRLSRAADQIAKNGEMISMRITSEFHRLRLKEIELAHRHLKALQREKELERERRAELREQQKAEQELRKEQERLEKEKSHYQATLDALRANGDEEGVRRILEKLEDVERAIQDVDYRAANIRAGYVYVISNIGAFGPDVVKIGMTRRLEPMDRVKELGDASVPFRFDVHALFFADDALAVEGMLHREFEAQRLNRVNLRREYFRVTPEDVLAKLREHDVEVLEFTTHPIAEEYRTSLAMS